MNLSPAAPLRRETAPNLRAWSAAGAVALLLGLGWLDVRTGGQPPMAVSVTLGLAYAALCLLHLEAAFLLILAFTPFSVQVIFRGAGSALQVPTEPMLFLALGFWLMRVLVRRSTRFEQKELTLALLAAFTACAISFLDSGSPVNTLKGIANATWYALFGVFLVNNLSGDRALRGVTAAWLVPGVALTLYSLSHVATGHYLKWAGYFWASPFFVDHGTFAAYLSFVFTLALALTIEYDGPRKFGFGVIALLTGAQVVLSMTRGAWIGLAAIVPLVALTSGRRLGRPGNVAFLGAGLVAITVVLAAANITRDVEKHTSTITDVQYKSNVERMIRWYAGWEMFRSDPLTGVGYGAYQDEYTRHRQFVVATDESNRRMGVHSEYLRVLAETGLLGAMAALASLILLFRIARRAIRGSQGPLERGLAVGMALGLVTYLAHATVNNYLEFDKAAVPVWTAIGILAALDHRGAARGVAASPGPAA